MTIPPGLAAKIEKCGCFNAAERDWIFRKVLTPRAATMRRHDRRARALASLAKELAPGASINSAAEGVASALRRYSASRWRNGDAALADFPSTYCGTVREHLWTAMHAGEGKVPSVRRIRFVLSQSWPSSGIATANAAVDGDLVEDRAGSKSFVPIA